MQLAHIVYVVAMGGPTPLADGIRLLLPVGVLLLQSRGLDFYSLPEPSRKVLLDDGLHLSAAGYERLGDLVADTIGQMVCS
jgi:lysophospholipase L1-like esterase